MKLHWLIGGAVLSLASGWALAQNAPESLLPPGFDNAAPAAPPPSSAPPEPAPAASARPAQPSASRPVVQSTAPGPDSPGSTSAEVQALDLAKLPSLEELEGMTPEEFEEVLGLKPNFDIPPAARRSARQVGIIGADEGGFGPEALELARSSLVSKALKGNRGKLISRWGHILLRRALASRLDTPDGLNASDFAAQRAALLLRMGETDAARQLVQDVDTGNYTSQLTDAAFNAYVATGDFTGICPIVISRGSDRKDPKWETTSAICAAFRGDSRAALRRMDRSLSRGKMSRIDVLLAQKYAGAAGRVRRAVTIEWDKVDSISPWRYGLATAVGLQPPERLMRGTAGRYASRAALAPMLGLEARAQAADLAGGRGVLSSAAMVDLYGQIFADEDTEGEWSSRAETLRDAYTGRDPAARLVAMQVLWNSAGGPAQRYSRQVLTAYAAARLPVAADLRDSAPDLIASMLTAGLDRNALRWADQVESGSQAWALLVLADPGRSNPVDEGALDSYFDDDQSIESRRSAFLLAGLAGLGRIEDGMSDEFSSRLEIDLKQPTRWTRLIDEAATRENKVLVAMLAGLGMQGTGWDKMTPRYLYNIVSALRRSGLEAEARMIAAEAVARG